MAFLLSYHLAPARVFKKYINIIQDIKEEIKIVMMMNKNKTKNK